MVAAGATAELSARAASAGGGAAIRSAHPLLGLMEMSVVTVLNRKNQGLVKIELQRRRLNLPHILAPAEARTGSLFLPMTSRPQRLIVHGHNAEQPLGVNLELGRLATLHIKPLTIRSESPVWPTRSGP